MKKIFKLLLICMSIFLISCNSGEIKDSDNEKNEIETHSKTGEILKGEHKLYEIKIDGNYVVFVWECENSKIYSKLPITKLRQVNENCQPYVKFKWSYSVFQTVHNDGMHPNDKTRWKDDDLLNEYERYVSDDEDSHVGLDEYN